MNLVPGYGIGSLGTVLLMPFAIVLYWISGIGPFIFLGTVIPSLIFLFLSKAPVNEMKIQNTLLHLAWSFILIAIIMLTDRYIASFSILVLMSFVCFFYFYKLSKKFMKLPQKISISYPLFLSVVNLVITLATIVFVFNLRPTL